MSAPMWDVIDGDMLDVLPTLAPVDAIVCDPPYGLAFMGKGWDHAVPGVDYWRAALDAAKPGAHLVAFGGTRTFHRLTCAIEDAGWNVRDVLSWLYGSGFPKSHNGPWGGTALKPAWEPIILARKSLAGTVAANVQAHGTGALNVDGCRIGFASEADAASAFPGGRLTSHGAGSLAGPGAAQDAERSAFTAERNALGRWPANVVLDEDAATVLDAQAPRAGAASPVRGTETSAASVGRVTGERARVPGAFHADTGGASRFFYCAKASRSERSEGNTHPTVKPVALMRWLLRLVTPAGGVVLDPFCGSGSTGVAAVVEGFRFVGVEREASYADIARRRLGDMQPQLTEVA